MINFHYETDFTSLDASLYTKWINSIIQSENFELGALEYIFCDDAYLLNINQQYLDHDTYTDIITFDYTEGSSISGDIFISLERVQENAVTFKEPFLQELHRVIAHGVLHLMGYKDKTEKDAAIMRAKEEEKIQMFHVEQ